MAIGGKPEPVYVVTDAQVASGEFTVAPGKCLAVASLDAADRGISGGSAIPVYVVDETEARRRGIQGGLKGSPVYDATTIRVDYGLQQAIPVYVVSGTLGGSSTEIITGNPLFPWLWLTYTVS